MVAGEDERGRLEGDGGVVLQARPARPRFAPRLPRVGVAGPDDGAAALKGEVDVPNERHVFRTKHRERDPKSHAVGGGRGGLNDLRQQGAQIAAGRMMEDLKQAARVGRSVEATRTISPSAAGPRVTVAGSPVCGWGTFLR